MQYSIFIGIKHCKTTIFHEIDRGYYSISTGSLDADFPRPASKVGGSMVDLGSGSGNDFLTLKVGANWDFHQVMGGTPIAGWFISCTIKKK